MHNKIRIFALFLCFIFVVPLIARETIQILPFNSVSLPVETLQNIELVLIHELKKSGHFDRVYAPDELIMADSARQVSESRAIALAKEKGIDLLLKADVVALGQKRIVQYSLIKPTENREIFRDEITALTEEDLDVVIVRIAKSIKEVKPATQLAEVGNITEAESLEPKRRGGRRFGGFSFGYLFPSNGYDDIDRSFTMDFRTGADLGPYNVGMQLAIRKGFAVNVFSSLLLSKKDFCPYFGAGAGFHWVSHKTEFVFLDNGGGYQEKSKREDGFEILLNSGIIAFRTYNFQLTFNLSYTLVLNDYNDQGIVFTIGFLK